MQFSTLSTTYLHSRHPYQWALGDVKNLTLNRRFISYEPVTNGAMAIIITIIEVILFFIVYKGSADIDSQFYQKNISKSPCTEQDDASF
jgi:hypothetical protein